MKLLDVVGAPGVALIKARLCARAMVPVALALLLGCATVAQATTVSVGNSHTLEIRNGKLYAWGNNQYGQIGDGTSSHRYSPVIVSLRTNVAPVAVSAGGFHSVAMGSDGGVYAWGDNAQGQLGIGSTASRSSPTAVSLPPGVTASAVSAGNFHSAAVGSDGRVYTWGLNNQGQLGDGTTTSSTSPVAVSLAAGVVANAVAVGVGHTVAIGSNGKAYAWGGNSDGQLGDGTTTPRTTPVEVSLPAGVTPTAVASGVSHCFAIGSDGRLYAWGRNVSGQLGNGSLINQNTPLPVGLPAGVTPVTVAAGSYEGHAIGSDGRLYAWGSNHDGQLGDGTTLSRSTPVVSILPVGMVPVAVAASSAVTVAVASNGQRFVWGNNSGQGLGTGLRSLRLKPGAVPLPPGVTPRSVAAGEGHSLAIGSDDRLYAWGNNTDGQLGAGSTGASGIPLAVNLPTGVVPNAIAAGRLHTLAIGSDGRLYAWGNNVYGQLGDGSTTRRGTPVTVLFPNGVTPITVAAGDNHSLAIGSNGRLYAWGSSDDGQLGNGSSGGNRLTPVVVQLPAGVTATAVAAGNGHSLAIGSNGRLYAWGRNTDGQLGNGGNSRVSLPVAINLPDSVSPTAVAARATQSLASGADGRLFSWGANYQGDLGNGTTTSRNTPGAVNLPAGVSPTLLAQGSQIIGSDGRLYTWGYNGSGQLGDGTTLYRVTPLVVEFAAGVTPVGVARGASHALAIGSDGTLYAWGGNHFGQLGDGSTPLLDKITEPFAVTNPYPSEIARAALAISPSPSVIGQPLTLTATVTGTGGGVPTGAATFRRVNPYGGAEILGVRSMTGSGQAQLTVEAPSSPGPYRFDVLFAGTEPHGETSSVVISHAVRTTSGTLLGELPESVFPGMSVTLTAAVSGYSPTGLVQFKDGGTNLGGPVSLFNGNASLQATIPPTIGSHSITANYLGDAYNLPSTSDAGVLQVLPGEGDVPLPAWAFGLLGLALLKRVMRHPGSRHA